jgi:hypothetical protein
MNTPAITAGTKPKSYDDLAVVLVGRGFSFSAPARQRETRQRELAAAAAEALAGARSSPPVIFFREPIAEVESWGRRHWRLHPLRKHRTPLETAPGLSAGEILEPLQGVTPGGEGGLDIFQMTQAEASERALEPELVHAAMKGTDGRRWRIGRLETFALYPYISSDGSYERAFYDVSTDDDWDALDLQPRRGEEERLVSGWGQKPPRSALSRTASQLGNARTRTVRAISLLTTSNSHRAGQRVDRYPPSDAAGTSTCGHAMARACWRSRSSCHRD